MRIRASIDERTLRRSFREQLKGRRSLIVVDKDLKGFALRVSSKGKQTFIVRAARKLVD